MIRVLLVDDHGLFRHGVRQMLSAQGGISVIEAESAAEMMQRLREAPVDVLLLDIEMPGRSGLDAVTEVKRDFPRVAVLVLSMYPEYQYGIRALKNGAVGYLNKNASPGDLVSAVQRAARGERIITPPMAQVLASNLAGEDSRFPHERLSSRELEVMRLIASGQRLAEIAQALDINVKTVSTYRTRILEKMGMTCNAELIRYVIEQGELKH